MNAKKYDVVVCGAGVAGCAGAVAAARTGAKTCLIESGVIPGGLATAGLVLVYLPLCDGYGKQTIFGLSQEFMENANKYGPVDLNNEEWKKGNGARLQTYFSPASLVLALDGMLSEAGVDIWYDTRVTGVRKRERHITGLSVFNKSGNLLIYGSVFIDATGDADIAQMSGEPCHSAGNASVAWVIEHRKMEKQSKFSFGRDFSTFIMADPIWQETVPPGIDGKTVSNYMTSTRKRYRELLDKEYESGCEDRKSRYPLLLPCMPTLRHTRCIRGRRTLTDGDIFRRFEDSVGIAPDWRRRGPLWEIPYSTLLAESSDNLLAAGRSSSATGDAWEITRVIPVAAMTGEAAGCAGALAIENKTEPAFLDAALLQERLRRFHSFPIHFSDLGLDGGKIAERRKMMEDEEKQSANKN